MRLRAAIRPGTVRPHVSLRIRLRRLRVHLVNLAHSPDKCVAGPVIAPVDHEFQALRDGVQAHVHAGNKIGGQRILYLCIGGHYVFGILRKTVVEIFEYPRSLLVILLRRRCAEGVGRARCEIEFSDAQRRESGRSRIPTGACNRACTRRCHWPPARRWAY